MLNFVRYAPSKLNGIRCCICGNNKNVKYEVAIHENKSIKFLPCCSVCTLKYMEAIQKNMNE